MRILLNGAYSTHSGYGSDMVGMAKALVNLGHDVVPLPVTVVPGMPKEVAQLFAKELKAPFDLGVAHLPPSELAATEYSAKSCRAVLGWTMWEKTRMDVASLQYAETWPDFDLLLCYDRVTADAIDALGMELETRLLQGGVEADAWPYVRRDWHATPFKFGQLGQLHARKDPFTAIEAFTQLQEDGELEGAEMHCKTNVPGLHPQMMARWPNVFIDLSIMTRPQVRDWYADKHVLVSPSHGEGKNLPCLEFMLTGGVTMATGWGGHQTWQHESYCYVLDYDLVPVNGELDVRHAQVRIEHLKSQMVDAYRNRSRCEAMGKLASSVIRQQSDWKAVANRMLQMGSRKL